MLWNENRAARVTQLYWTDILDDEITLKAKENARKVMTSVTSSMSLVFLKLKMEES